MACISSTLAVPVYFNVLTGLQKVAKQHSEYRIKSFKGVICNEHHAFLQNFTFIALVSLDQTTVYAQIEAPGQYFSWPPLWGLYSIGASIRDRALLIHRFSTAFIMVCLSKNTSMHLQLFESNLNASCSFIIRFWCSSGPRAHFPSCLTQLSSKKEISTTFRPIELCEAAGETGPWSRRKPTPSIISRKITSYLRHVQNQVTILAKNKYQTK